MIAGMLVGEYKKPVRVIAFNTSDGWSRDVSEEIAWEVLARATSSGSKLPESTYSFVVLHVGEQAAMHAQAL